MQDDLPPLRVWGPEGTRPLLALHCSLAHAGEWAALAAALPAQRVVAPDLPGHGKQPEWDGLADLHGSSTAQALALAARLAAEAGGPVDLIGHSFGGTVALRLALQRPDLIRRLVLVEPVIFAAARMAGDPAYDAFVAGHRDVEARLRAGDAAGAARAFHAAWGSGPGFDALPAGLRAYMLARIRLIPAQNEVLAADAAGLLAPGRPEALARPVLLVEGSASPPVIAAIQRELARRLPDARRETVPGAAHMLPVTHTAALAALVRAHLG